MTVLDELAQLVAGTCTQTDNMRVVCDTLPGRALCAATIIDRVLWVVIDLDKAMAHRHALQMIREYKAAVADAFQQCLEWEAAPTGRVPLLASS